MKDTSLLMHLSNEWNLAVQEDGLFESFGSDTAAWKVSSSNMQELLEALHLSSHINADDAIKLLKQESLGYEDFKISLYKELVEVRAIPFTSLIQAHFSIPVDRISKFLKMLRAEISSKETPSQVE